MASSRNLLDPLESAARALFRSRHPDLDWSKQSSEKQRCYIDAYLLFVASIKLEAADDEPILIEVDSRIIRDLVILAANALQIATGASQTGETPSCVLTHQTELLAATAQNGGAK